MTSMLITLCILLSVQSNYIQNTSYIDSILSHAVRNNPKLQPINTGKYIVLSESIGPELVYRSQNKNSKTGMYRYFVKRIDKNGIAFRLYLDYNQSLLFVKQFGDK